METGSNPGSERKPALWLSEADQVAMKDFWRVYDRRFDEIVAGATRIINEKPDLAVTAKTVVVEKLEEQRRISRDRMRSAILDGEWEAYLENLQREGAVYGQSNIEFEKWSELLSAFRTLTIGMLFEEYGPDQERLIAVVAAFSKFTDQAMAIIGQACLDSKENTIRQQHEAIQELSTPVLALRDQLLLLPIIGLIDSFRAQQITEHLLQAIRDYRARVVVLDITGVLTVDSMVANHLIKTAEAARLMGAQAMITGLSTEVAQTLVRIGVDLSRLNTLGDLHSGIEAADRILGYELVRTTNEKTTIVLGEDRRL